MSIETGDLNDLREITDARHLDACALVEQLQFMTAKTHGSAQRRPMTESEKLLDEAFWYASWSDLDEAIYRLSMIDDEENEDGENEE